MSTEITHQTILDALQMHVETQGDQTAYTFLKSDDERVSITYRELDDRAKSIAQYLLTKASPGDRALMMYPAGLDFIEAFLGCLYAGIVAVPAYAPKKNRNAGRILAIAHDCQPTLLLCNSDTEKNVLENFAQNVPGAQVVSTDAIDNITDGFDPDISSDQLAFLQYTSGSTAAPRGVMVSHGNIAANELAIKTNFQHSENDVAISWLPMFHDMGLIGGILQPLFVGFPCYFMAPSTFVREPIKWLRAISEFRGVFSGAPNFAYDLCVQKVTTEQKKDLDLSSWIAFNGAEPVRADTLERFSDAFFECGFRPDACFPCYGMAETTLIVAGGPPLAKKNILTLDSSALEHHLIVEAENGQKLVSCGQVAPDLEVAIVNPETFEASAINDVGEIWIRGASVASGYWNQSDEVNAVFHARFEGNEHEWFRSGDYGFLRNNELYITGRVKDLIIIRGRNIYPQDVELVVEQHFKFLNPNSCTAFSVEHQGEEKLIVVAEGTREMVRWTQDPESSNGEVAKLKQMVEQFRSNVLDEFEVAVQDVLFVRPTTFPRTSSGKLQRQLVRKLVLNGELEVVWKSQNEAANDSTQPENDQTLVNLICRTIAGWAAEEDREIPRLNESTSFVSLGIDSIAAADIGIRLEKKLSIDVEAEIFYQYRTIGELAYYLSRNIESNSTSKERRYKPLSKSDYLNGLNDGLKRFQEFRQAGHDYFATEIESLSGNDLSVNGHNMLMMASYSYLGLLNRTEVNQAAVEAIEEYGTGVHGSRILAGNYSAHQKLEKELASFMGTDDAIVYSSGFITNLSSIASLVGKGDVVLGDELNHASIVDGCNFSDAEFLTFSHNNMQDLERLLKINVGRKILVVVDAVFSMEGSIAPLPDIVALCEQYGALVMVDEAHSIGVLGDNGRGIQEHFRLPNSAIDIKMGTLSKTVASSGGFIAANKQIIHFLKHKARGFVFSGALPAAQVGAARKSLEIIQTETHLAGRLRKLCHRFVTGLRELGYEVPPTESAIIPIIFSSEQETLEAVGFCRKHGLFVVPVFYPAVPMDKPRIRATVMATFTEEDVDFALDVFRKLKSIQPSR